MLIHERKDMRYLLFTLAERDETARDVAQAVVSNSDKLPENVRNRLLLTLSEKNEADGYVARAMEKHFDKIPEDMFNRLFFTLVEKDKAIKELKKLLKI